MAISQPSKTFFFGFLTALSTFSICIFVSKVANADSPAKPHVIFIFADDLGWDDISFHGSPQIPTPNLDALASSGIMLNNYYGERICTPSRAALMTGKYPIRLGLQYSVIKPCQPKAVPLEEVMMPQYFKDLGYATHMVGKWHLGNHKKEYTPIQRGFDSFFGYYNGLIDYYDYTFLVKELYGIDLQNGTEVVRDVRGQYATDLFTEKAKNIIENHDTTKPLFLYLSHLAVHSGNSYMYVQAPPELVNRFKYIKNESRRTFAGVVAALDISVGEIFKALHEKDMLSNSIIVFSSDNGGESLPKYGGYSTNYPLRGKKMQEWEGGIRIPAFIWSPLLHLQEPRVSMQLMHLTDWLPTLYSAAGGNVENLGDIDGQSLWEALLTNSSSPRPEILHNIDPVSNISAIRVGDLKLVTGNIESGSGTFYGKELLEDMEKPESMDEWVFRNGSIVKNLLIDMGLFLPTTPDTWRRNTEVQCNGDPETANECDPSQAPCLYDIAVDPCEINNIADQHPQDVDLMLRRIKNYTKQAAEAQNQEIDLHGDPRCHGFAFVPWLDEEHLSNCPFQ